MTTWFWRDLKDGETGPDVDVVQRLLMAPATGVYDEATRAHVRGLQLMYQVAATGIVDAETADLIGDSVESSLPPEWYRRPLRKGMRGEDVAALRQLLHLPPGETFDEEVRDAILRYQSAHRLRLTGTVSRDLAYRLHGLS